MTHNLSFEQAPPIWVPYRFFVTAPLFGVLAGLVLAFGGPDALVANWTPGVLAATHLIVAGLMLQTMCGSLLQFVAVVAGANIWRPRLVAGVVHPLITLACLALAAGFLFTMPEGFLLAAAAFTFALGGFLVVMTAALWQTSAQGMTIHALRIAAFGLLMTVVLGVALAITLGLPGRMPADWPLFQLIQTHVAWGLAGWALMLVIGVSYLVVPMFQMTPAYPLWLTRVLPLALLAELLAWTVQLVPVVDPAQPWLPWVVHAGVLVAAAFGGVTLWLQARRRRRQTDTTFQLFRGAMIALVAFALSWAAFEFSPELKFHPRAGLWLGMLVIPGVFVSVITGMLYKIMPFLNWLHLQREAGLGAKLPNMKQMIPERVMRGQAWAHLAAVALLLGAVVWPVLVLPAGLAFAVACLWLWWNLVGAARLYVRVSRSLSDPAVAG